MMTDLRGRGHLERNAPAAVGAVAGATFENDQQPPNYYLTTTSAMAFRRWTVGPDLLVIAFVAAERVLR